VTWENGGPHSGSWWFHGKDGVAGSIPAGGSTKAMTSGNAGHFGIGGAVGRGRPVVFSLPVGWMGGVPMENTSLVSGFWSLEPAPASRCSWPSSSAPAMNLTFRRIRVVVGAADMGRPDRSQGSGL
jgi:hypothetical protein